MLNQLMMKTLISNILILMIFFFISPVPGHSSVDKTAIDKFIKHYKKYGSAFQVYKRDVKRDQIKDIESKLIKKWEELELLLVCAKLPMCVTRYYKDHDSQGEKIKMSFVESFNMAVQGIEQLTQKLTLLKRRPLPTIL